MPADETELLLIERIRAGEAEAWQECIDRYERRLLAYAESRLRHRAASEDVVQETFTGFLISLPNYDSSTPLESWLFSIAAHKLTDYLRREGRRPTIPLLPPDDEGRVNEPPGSARQASSMARSRERRGGEENVLAAALDDLITGWLENGEFERLQCMELLFVVGLPNRTVASRLGITEQAVANHKHFVVTKLKDAARRAHLQDLQLADYGIT